LDFTVYKQLIVMIHWTGNIGLYCLQTTHSDDRLDW